MYWKTLGWTCVEKCIILKSFSIGNIQCCVLKYVLKNFSPWALKNQKTFMYLCRQTLNPIHTIFSTVNSISDMNNICKFHEVWRIFTRIKVYTDGQPDRQIECINNFQLCWKVLKSFLEGGNTDFRLFFNLFCQFFNYVSFQKDNTFNAFQSRHKFRIMKPDMRFKHLSITSFIILFQIAFSWTYIVCFIENDFVLKCYIRAQIFQGLQNTFCSTLCS